MSVQHGGKDFVCQFYGPDEAAEGKFGDAPSVSVPSISETIDPRLVHSIIGKSVLRLIWYVLPLCRLHVITKNASKATRITVRENDDLEDWVEDEGRLVLIGEAAHPFPVSTTILRAS